MNITMVCGGNEGGMSLDDIFDAQVTTSSGYTFTKDYKMVIVDTISTTDRTGNFKVNGNLPSQTHYSSNSSNVFGTYTIRTSSMVWENVKSGQVLTADSGNSWGMTFYGFN